MNYVILITVALIGIALGMYIARRNANAKAKGTPCGAPKL